MSQELTLIERAEQALAFTQTKDKLAELAKSSERIVGITNGAGRDECHAARMRLKNMRIEVAKRGKDARDDATKFGKAVIAKENELIAVIEPEETRLQALQDAWDAARQREREAKVRAEQERIEAGRAALKRIADLPLACIGLSMAEFQERFDAAANLKLDDELPADVLDQGRQIYAEAMKQMQAMFRERLDAEAAAAKLAAERAELDRQRAEQERIAAAERARVDQERAEAEARAKAERDAHEAQMRKEREEHEARIAAERQAAREEQERRDAEQAAERKRIADEREALERQQAEQRRVEEARVEAERKAADEHALRERLISLKLNAPPLLDAAIEALKFLLVEGYQDHDVALTLGFAIEKETTPEAKAA